MSQTIFNAIKENDLETLKKYFSDSPSNIFFNNNDYLMFAAGTNKIDVVDFLLTSKDIPIHSDDSVKSLCILSAKVICCGEHDGIPCIRVADDAKEKALVTAIQYGCFPTVRYLLTCDKFSTPININYNHDEALAISCSNSQLSIAQYLLTYKKLPRRSNIQTKDNRALRWAFRSSLPNDNITKYLLTSPKLNEHANIYDNNCKPFFELANNPRDKESLWKYLIFDYKLKIYPPIKNFMEKNPNHIAAQLLYKRELNCNLNCELSINSSHKKFYKSKI